jgi:hypothetical protein
MAERKPKFPTRIAWSDVIIAGAVSWVMGKVFDYLYKLFNSKIVLPKGSDLMRKTGTAMMLFSIQSMTDFDLSEPLVRTPFFLALVKSFLESHARAHREDSDRLLKNCEICKLIFDHAKFFWHILPKTELYPPIVEN